MTGHAEYDRDTLAKEYFRDVNKGIDPKVLQLFQVTTVLGLHLLLGGATPTYLFLTG